MFIGHFGLGMAGKRAAPGVSLPVLLLASDLPDLIWIVLIATGAETVRIVPKDTAYPVHIESCPWSHSLLMVCVWGALFALVYRQRTGDTRGAAVTGALVISHWVLDWINHPADIPLYPGGRIYGLGLATHPIANFAVEVALLLGGAAIYQVIAKSKPKGKFLFWLMIALLVAMCAGGIVAKPPASTKQLLRSAFIAIAGTLLFSVYLNRKGSVKPVAGSPGRVKVRTEQNFY